MDLKIRIFALAKELGIDSKVLIEHCNSAGIKLKNSPLASISPEERDLVLGHMNHAAPPAAAAEETQMTPFARDPSRDVGGKIRSIKPVVSRPPLARDRGKPVGETEIVTAEPPALPAEQVPSPAEELPKETVASEPSVNVPSSAPAAASAGPVRGPLQRRTGGPGETPPEGTAEAPARPAALRPDEYVSPAGSRSTSTIREMKPRGTILDTEQAQQRRPKPKAKPALPNVAAALEKTRAIASEIRSVGSYPSRRQFES